MHETTLELVSWRAETRRDDLRRFKSLEQEITNKNILDIGSGNCGFIKYALDLSNRVDGVELENNFKAQFLREGLGIYNSVHEIPENKKYDIITLFHVLEHIENPTAFLKKLSSMLSEQGKIIIEVPNIEDALISQYNLDAFKEHYFWSCHLYYYSQKTLESMISKAGLSSRIEQVQRYPLSNHLYWLTDKRPGGHEQLKWLNSKEVQKNYSLYLKAKNSCDTLFAFVTRPRCT